MIQIKHLPFIPDLPYSDYAHTELKTYGHRVKMIEKASCDIWVVQLDGKPLVVGGIIPQSLLSKSRLWFLMCEGFEQGSIVKNLKVLRSLMGLLDKEHGGTETIVEMEWREGIRFARFLGYKETERQILLDNKTYVVMER